MTISATTNSNGASIISGLSSGFDWQSLITQLAAADEQGVETVQTQMSTTQAQLSAWQSFNTQLLSLKTAADSLDSPAGFNQFTTTMTSNNSSVQASTLLSATASSSASPAHTLSMLRIWRRRKPCVPIPLPARRPPSGAVTPATSSSTGKPRPSTPPIPSPTSPIRSTI